MIIKDSSEMPKSLSKIPLTFQGNPRILAHSIPTSREKI